MPYRDDFRRGFSSCALMTDSAQAAAARPRWPARFCQWLKRGWRRRLVSLAVFAAALLAVGAWQTRHVPDGMAPALAGTLPDGRLEQGHVSSLMQNWPVLTVATRSGDGQAVARTLARRGLGGWPTIVDEDGAIARAWGISGVPAFIVIDPQGQIRAASMGYTPTLTMRLRLWWAQRF